MFKPLLWCKVRLYHSDPSRSLFYIPEETRRKMERRLYGSDRRDDASSGSSESACSEGHGTGPLPRTTGPTLFGAGAARPPPKAFGTEPALPQPKAQPKARVVQSRLPAPNGACSHYAPTAATRVTRVVAVTANSPAATPARPPPRQLPTPPVASTGRGSAAQSPQSVHSCGSSTLADAEIAGFVPPSIASSNSVNSNDPEASPLRRSVFHTIRSAEPWNEQPSDSDDGSFHLPDSKAGPSGRAGGSSIASSRDGDDYSESGCSDASGRAALRRQVCVCVCTWDGVHRCLKSRLASPLPHRPHTTPTCHPRHPHTLHTHLYMRGVALALYTHVPMPTLPRTH